MRLIDADSAIDVVHKWLDDMFCISSTADEVTVFKRLRGLPSVDAAPVRHGRWKLVDGEEPRRYGCSECRTLSWYGVYNYCPNCGAKMDLKEEGT